nr:Protein kinase C domain containing protein [Haemonchus contortus]
MCSSRTEPISNWKHLVSLFDEFEAELMNRNGTSRSPSVILADDNPAYSYGFGSPKRNNAASGGWFAGLKAKISQLAGISEWMSQLGIGDTPTTTTAVQQKNMASPTTSARREVDDDSISYHSISLDDCTAMPEWDEEHWDFGASFLADLDSSHVWNDTLERQHFGPLKGLLTTGGTKADSHRFVSITLVHPTWCDKCGDFIWGLLKQASKCENCNYTCHSRCQELVTLECRSAGSSLASDEFPSIYPKLLDGTLGTIPKELHLPPLQLHSSFGDSDKENETCFENPLFTPSKMSRPIEPPSSSAPSRQPREQEEPQEPTTSQTLRISEVYVKEDTPFEWSPAYRDENLAEKIEEYNKTSDGLSMRINDDGETFSGHIQIHMNLTRPINVVAGEKPPSVYDVVNTGGYQGQYFCQVDA